MPEQSDPVALVVMRSACASSMRSTPPSPAQITCAGSTSSS